MLIKTPEGKHKDVKILNAKGTEYVVNAENYIVPKGEEGKYHAIIEVPQFSQTDGSRLSKPRIQKFGPKWFESSEGRTALERQGYKIEILHDPKEWNKKNSEIAAENKAKKMQEARDAKAQADQAKIHDGVLDALQAMGLTPELIAQMNQPKKQADSTTAKTTTVQNPSTGKTTETKVEKPTQEAAKDADKK